MYKLSYSVSGIIGKVGPPSAAMISGTLLLCPFVLGRIDRIDPRVAEYAHQVLRARLPYRTEIGIRVIGIDDFLSMANQNHRGHWTPKRRVVAKDDDGAQHGEQ